MGDVVRRIYNGKFKYFIREWRDVCLLFPFYSVVLIVEQRRSIKDLSSLCKENHIIKVQNRTEL